MSFLTTSANWLAVTRCGRIAAVKPWPAGSKPSFNSHTRLPS